MPALYWAVPLLVPALIILLAHHQPWANRLGVVVICYLAGMLLGSSGVLPTAALQAAEHIGDVSIAMALPLLLMSLDIRRWRDVAGKAMLSMLLATTSVVAVATCLFFWFASAGNETPAHLAAMSVGVYTGGTVNLASIKAGLDIADNDYLLFHSVDTLLGAIYMLGMMTVGASLFRRVLPRSPAIPDVVETDFVLDDDYAKLVQRKNLGQVLATLGVGLLAVALATLGGQWLLPLFGVPKITSVFILLLTTVGIAFSFTPLRHQLPFAYPVGMYMIYVFCFAVASRTSLDSLDAINPMVFGFVLVSVIGSVALHAVLCRLTGVDSDTFMVTSVSAVCSPPFVPLVARALNNPGLILSGMMTGILGYAIGNYLGISLALVLMEI